MMDIQEARVKIDSIDRQITELFCQRMQCSAAIGAYKAALGLPIHVPTREEAIIETLTRDAEPEMKEYITKLYRQIFDLSRDYQQKLTQKDEEHVG